jgi:hypothetical protein
MKDNGVVTPEVWKTLMEVEPAYPCMSDSKSQDRLLIVIDVKTRTLVLYQNDKEIRRYPVAVGKSETPTPLGEWNVVHKGVGWGSGFGTRWMGLNVPWGKYGIHGTRQPWAIGKENVSGGCIRMNSEDAKDLYQYIPHGTKVTIVFENQPFRNLKDGDFGSDVYKVQIALKKLGYFHNWCNGKFSTETKKAVYRFQTDVKLAQTGIVNISTWEKLMKQYEESLLE